MIYPRGSRSATFLMLGLNVFVTALFIAWAAKQLVEGHNWGDDFGLYLQLADNLRNGRPYNELNTGIQVPFGFPLLLAVWEGLFGTSFVALKALNIAAWVVVAWIGGFLASKAIGRVGGLCVLAGHFLIPSYYVQQQSVLSDLPFVAAVNLLLLLCFLYFRASREQRGVGWVLFASIPVTLFAALLIRPAGLPLVATLVAAAGMTMLIKRDKHTIRSMAGFVGAAVVIFLLYVMTFGASAGGHLKNAIQGVHGGNESIVIALFHLMKTRALEEILNLDVLLTWYPAETYVGSLLLLGIMVGAIAFVRLTSDIVLPLYAVAYVGFLLLIPWQQGYRYLLPLASVALIFLFSPIRLLVLWTASASKPAARRISAMLATVYSVLIGVLGIAMIQGVAQLKNYNDDETNDGQTRALIDWIRRNTDPDAQVCAFKPRAVMYFASRKTCHIPADLVADPVTYLRGQGSSYAVLTLRPAYGYSRLIEQFRVTQGAREAFRNDDYVIFKVR